MSMGIKEVKQWAKEKVKGKRLTILVVLIILSALSGYSVVNDKDGLLSSLLSIAMSLLLFIVTVGYTKFMLNFINDKEYSLDQLWSYFGDWKNLATVWIHETVMLFLYYLLLIVPGIIKTISYSLVPYILVDAPNMSSGDVLDLSTKMMNGHKMDYFKLELSFIGWHLLAALTLGILEIWIAPYQATAMTKFLSEVKSEYEKANSKTVEA